MKGILLIKFTRSPGAYIDFEYPKDLSKKLNIDPADLMNIYGIHRMRRTDPNYFQMKIKHINIASFYTGFYEDHYVGATDCVLTAIISENDKLPKDFEGMIRRIAQESLSLIDDPSFTKNFIEYYKKLELGSLDPFWYESIEGKEVQIQETIANNEFVEFNMEELNLEEYFENFEVNNLQAKIRKLNSTIRKQQGMIDKLQQTINEGLSSKSSEIELIHKLKDQIDDQNAIISQLKKRNAELEEENKKLLNSN